MQAHAFLTKRRITVAVISIWTTATATASPTIIFNDVVVTPGSANTFCVFKLTNEFYKTIFKFTEFAVYFVIPLVIQVILYILISKRLRASTRSLKLSISKSRQHADSHSEESTLGRESKKDTVTSYSYRAAPYWKASNTVSSRHRVIHMLTGCLLVYIVSYTPAQVMLFYDTFSQQAFAPTWTLRTFLFSLTFINASANPIIYCICSEAFRSKFKRMYGCGRRKALKDKQLLRMESATKSGSFSRKASVRTEMTAEHNKLQTVAEEGTDLL